MQQAIERRRGTTGNRHEVFDAHRLEMVPRRKPMAEGIDRLRIWIDRTRLVMTRMVLDYPGGDSKTLELHDIRTNVAIDESVFGLLARKRGP